MLNATPLLKLYAKYRSYQKNFSSPASQQTKVLMSLVKRCENTKFGKDHGFSKISSIAEYQKQVPLRTYEQMWPQYWEKAFPSLTNASWPDKIKFSALSSGTSSGVTKYLPLTDDMLKGNTKAALDILCYHVDSYKDSQIFAGKSFVLGGSTDLRDLGEGILGGDLSGIVNINLPWWIKERYFPPAELALLSNWEEKIRIMGERALKEDIRSLSCVPSWMLLFFNHLQLTTGKTFAENFPNVELIIHGGISFEPYRKTVEELIKGSKAVLREVYPASEGFIAIQDKGSGEGMRLITDHGIFYEFVPVDELDSPNPTRHWVNTVEKDINYAVVLTTNSGLFSYIIGDTVRFVETDPPRVLVTGRTSYFLSAFGEHLIGEEIEKGILTAANACGIAVSEFSVGPVYPKDEKELGSHIYVIELVQEKDFDSALFLKTLDDTLYDLNEDYAAHRSKGFGLNPPTLKFVKPGTFAAWMKSRGKLGGQNKVPRVILKDDVLQGLVGFKNLRINNLNPCNSLS